MHGSFIYDKVARTSGVRYVALLSNKDKTQDLMIIMTIIAITVMHSALQLILTWRTHWRFDMLPLNTNKTAAFNSSYCCCYYWCFPLQNAPLQITSKLRAHERLDMLPLTTLSKGQALIITITLTPRLQRCFCVFPSECFLCSQSLRWNHHSSSTLLFFPSFPGHKRTTKKGDVEVGALYERDVPSPDRKRPACNYFFFFFKIKTLTDEHKQNESSAPNEIGTEVEKEEFDIWLKGHMSDESSLATSWFKQSEKISQCYWQNYFVKYMVQFNVFNWVLWQGVVIVRWLELTSKTSNWLSQMLTLLTSTTLQLYIQQNCNILFFCGNIQ